MMRRLRHAVVITVAIGLLGSCSSGDEPSRHERAIAWADQVCGSIRAGGEALSALPDIDPAKPVKSKRNVLGYLDTVSTALDDMASDLHTAGTPPVRGGMATYGSAMETIEDLSSAVDDATTRLRAAEVRDRESLRKALTGVGTVFTKVSTGAGPAGELSANPALRQVFADAERCEGIDSVIAAR
ncbi:hypothetical protein [Haloechinothrix halophila]|uniref:hypothetical protein n=1 Tax=Haloechinothrix halophila TaxID=1069073 RepID=UPI0003FBDBA0|nr:hypothetical protein [Haloechinothrix halophila]